METAAQLALLGTLINIAVSLMLSGAYAALPSKWLRERTVAAWGLTLITFGIALVLTNRQLGRPLGSDVTAPVILGIVVLCTAVPLWWLATLAWSEWRARRER